MVEAHGIIRKLEPHVIAKIAAGEVLVRPAAAIKELIENSIDAGATTIKINLAANPLEYAEISDDGCGVSPEDMAVICQRFTTSKTHDNIDGVKSFGFRGEALSALSHVANVTIASRTAQHSKRTVMRYKEGDPIADAVDEVPGSVGFTIKYQNLFFNMDTRERTLSSSPSVEFNLCLELVQKYAVHFPHINFVFHKVGSSTNEVNTQRDKTNYGDNEHIDDLDQNHFKSVHLFPPDAIDTPELIHYRENVEEYSKEQLKTVRNAIKSVYGPVVADTLYDFQTHSTGNVYYNCKGFFTHPNQPNRCHSFILFINNRLVDHPTLRKNIDTIYKELIHKKQRRFVYLSIYMPYERIDANVHPSKEKVFFQHQDQIIDEIEIKLKEQLQSILKINTDNMQNTSAYTKMEKLSQDSEKEGNAAPNPKRATEMSDAAKTRAKCRVRNDYKQMDISSFVIPTYIQQSNADLDTCDEFFNESRYTEYGETEQDATDMGSSASNTQQDEETQQDSGLPKLGSIEFSLMDITGEETGFSDMWNIPYVKKLIKDFELDRDKNLTEIILNSVFVGAVDKQYIILQHDTHLYMVDIVQIAKECTFQSIIWRIGQLPKLVLNPPICLIDIISFALAREEYQKEDSNGTLDKTLFTDQAKEMVEQFNTFYLKEYFGFTIENNMLCSIPKIISNYFPGHEYLPGLILSLFSLKLVDEEKAVTDIARVISDYLTSPPVISVTTDDPNVNESNYEHYLSKVLLAAVQRFPDLSLSKNKIDKGVIIKLAEQELLYRIFERC
ncbi:DNA mismatch repair protein Mlh1 [Babesia sp. Xinjiang]|uniref:DNA mismatch repair protein Mlh1 n=1 Tax=Babesia sp. Xinjiang TaxID=462227 RepID=UPI000A2419EE|nr:DNA mismatch repair protein Mlh1 [Babesia sp. Xinjiang]ORM39342.1 DNA mismatch repair protein Mlh1 [Babesia sp. Xinjiang]